MKQKSGETVNHDSLVSITLTDADLIRAASPHLLNKCPDLGFHERYEIAISRVVGGWRFDVIRPVEDAT